MKSFYTFSTQEKVLLERLVTVTELRRNKVNFIQIAEQTSKKPIFN